ncbi:hypothetical protein [Streptomyces sp. NPDC058695]|uniref:hypothetical protein n=1 Tax=Streptomyces sp. NPDC058695 TaxID=3346604 RepID=UPI00364F0C50
MPHSLPPLIPETTALSVAGAGLHRYGMGSALIATGADATVVIVEAGDSPGVSGVQDSTKVLLRGDTLPVLYPRFDFESPLPIRLFARMDGGCLPLGAARCRGLSDPANFDYAALELDQPLTREMLDVVRPVPAPGPVPDVDWVDHVAADPIQALESFALGWFPAEEPELAEEGNAAGELGSLPEALVAFRRVARLRPALRRFRDPVLEQPKRASGPFGDRLVFAVQDGADMDWSIPWPLEEPGVADPRVWCTDDPCGTEPETFIEEELLSRFLLQFTLYEATIAAPYQAWTYCMPTARLDTLWSMLRPIPLSPFLPTYTAEKLFVAPGLLMSASVDESEATVAFGALHRATLTPLLAHGFRWSRFDG